MSHRVSGLSSSHRVSQISPRNDSRASQATTPRSHHRMLSSTSSSRNGEYQLVSDQDSPGDEKRQSQIGVQFSLANTFQQFNTSGTMRFNTEALQNAMHQGEPDWKRGLQRLVQSMIFQALMALAIVGNAFVIGLETDYPDSRYWSYCENGFLVIFLFELIARMVGFGVSSYLNIYGDDFFWNTFDLLIVSLGILDSAAEVTHPWTAHTSSDGGVSTLFRMIRLLRILRIFKIIRFLKHLYMLAHGFIEAAQSVFWVTILMAFVHYICSIVLVRMVGNLPETDEHHAFLKEQYGTIVKSMLSLFDLMSQPDMEPYHGLRRDYPWLTLFLIGWIIFGSFGMIALLTGVISESMFEKNALRVEAEHLEREQKRNALNVRLGEVFDRMTATSSNDQEWMGNHAGEVTIDQVLEALPDCGKIFADNMVAYTEHDMLHVATIMDADESGGISKEEFVHGLISIAEDVRPMSIAELFHCVQLVKARIEKAQRRLDTLEDVIREGHKTDHFMNLELKLMEIGEAQDKATENSGRILETVQSLAAGNEDKHRDQLLNLETKVNQVMEAQVKSAADSRLQLEIIQRLAAGLSQHQVLGVPAVNHNDTGLTAKLSACEAGIAETRDIVSDLQIELKKAVADMRMDRGFGRLEGVSSLEGVYGNDLLKAAASETDPHAITQERASLEPDERLHHAEGFKKHQISLTNAGPSESASDGGIADVTHQRSEPSLSPDVKSSAQESF